MQGGSGLFALLPQPKHVSIKKAGRTLLPHMLTKKLAAVNKPAGTESASTDLPLPASRPVTEADNSENDEDGSTSGNYFSIGDSSQQGALLSASSYSVTSSMSTLPPVRRQQSPADTQPTPDNETPTQFDSTSGGSLADAPLHFKSTMEGFVGPSGPTRQEQATYYPQMLEPINNEDYNMVGVDEVCVFVVCVISHKHK